jgi:hypothetical protein
MSKGFCIVLLGALAMIGCQREPDVPLGGYAQELGNPALDGVPGVPGVPGGVYTASCEAACNSADVICGTVANDLGQTCCCIGGCPGWAAECAAGVQSGDIGPGASPVGGGVFTGSCEAACNGAGVTCGTAENAAGQTCCCVGSCPQWAEACAAAVESGDLGPGVIVAVPGAAIGGL